MDKFYEHQKFEKETYENWEKSGAFSPTPSKGKKTFTIIMPPPNANENLHIGHARFITIEDILTRYHRMLGESTLWLPGADHAGIETQYVFEKKLKEEGKSRFDYDQETLYKMIWDYVQTNKKNMENQLKVLGSSCDWERGKFTLDSDIIKTVYKNFKKLSTDDLLYRGERIVNFCPRCGTAYSQLEVDTVEQEDNLYFLDYETLTIATTRPETIFADVAVAVNPKDKKYEKLLGKTANLPLINRAIPIISDNLVDPEFGTGALKITPGHDATDFEIGQNHNLDAISVINEAGRMINTPQNYLGLKALAAREEVVKDLEKAGKIVKIEKIKHFVGVCYKDKGIIEPLLSKQWYIKVKLLTQKALKAISSKQVKFASLSHEKIAKHWLTNLRDWNISRQIVWGIRIPAFKCQDCQKWTITEGENPDKCDFCGKNNLVQDTDTFDTWFSSSQWPFATLQNTKPGDFESFYPTSVMETAYDIIPFWVIRMIMMGLYVTGKVPFENVLIHGLVRDKDGQKISKSKGNVINPLEMTEKYGADALRMSMVWGALIENDICLSEDNIRGQRNFGNKLWNIARYAFMEKVKMPSDQKDPDNQLITKDLEKTVQKVTQLMDKYRLSEAAEELYDFVWHKLADNYLEKIKNKRPQTQETLERVLLTSLKLLHPFMPFVTEKIYQTGFAKNAQDLLITSSWPIVK
jgi:valyl-tRNA synthetase